MNRLVFCRTLAAQAGRMAHAAFGSPSVSLKGRHDEVTAMDRAVERFIRSAITAAWPDDALRPERQLLDEAAAARQRWPSADPRCLHIVGVRQETVTRAERRGREFHYTFERDGDGTVPLALAALPGAAHWYVAEKHGGLPNLAKWAERMAARPGVAKGMQVSA